MNAAQLLDALTYERKALELYLTVACLFAGFAVLGVIALRSENNRDRIHSLAFGAMSVAAMTFIFATAMDVIWLPVSHLERMNTVPKLTVLMNTSDWIVVSMLVGLVSLIVAMGLLGFVRSRRMGIFVLVLAVIVVIALLTQVIAIQRVAN